jgi:hypothetical protein
MRFPLLTVRMNMGAHVNKFVVCETGGMIHMRRFARWLGGLFNPQATKVVDSACVGDCTGPPRDQLHIDTFC